MGSVKKRITAPKINESNEISYANGSILFVYKRKNKKNKLERKNKIGEYVMRKQIRLYLKNYQAEVKAVGEELRNQPMPQLTEELFAIYENTGNRLQYENIYFERRRYIVVFALLSIMNGREEDIQKLEEVLTEICKEECWALPAHVNRAEDSNWRIYIDLFAAETAQALAEITTILESKLSEEIRMLVRENVYRRVLDPFYKSDAPYSYWENCEHNWCAVCAGSIGSASLYYMEEDTEALKMCLERICKALNCYIAGFGEDGACKEGLGYFSYGMSYFVAFASQLYTYSKGSIDLLANEKCESIASFQQKCYFKEGISISFSDGKSKEHFKIGLTSYLAMRYPNVTLPNINLAERFGEDTCFRWISYYRDYLWTMQYLEKETCRHKYQKTAEQNKVHILEQSEINYNKKEENKLQITLPQVQWSICQNKQGIGMAAKGGTNDEPHNHNDIGSFLYVNKKNMLLTDLGAGEYTKEYFGEGRYHILCNSSLSHNVPIINGQLQKAGKEYICDKFETDGRGKTSIHFPNAYEKGLLDSLERTLIFEEKSGRLVVEDRFKTTDKTTSIQENLVTQYKPEIKENQIIIKGAQEACSITIKTENKVNITCLEKIHRNHSGIEEMVYLIQWDVLVEKIAISRFEVEAVCGVK